MRDKLFKTGVDLLKIAGALLLVSIALPIAGLLLMFSWELLKTMP